MLGWYFDFDNGKYVYGEYEPGSDPQSPPSESENYYTKEEIDDMMEVKPLPAPVISDLQIRVYNSSNEEVHTYTQLQPVDVEELETTKVEFCFMFRKNYYTGEITGFNVYTLEKNKSYKLDYNKDAGDDEFTFFLITGTHSDLDTSGYYYTLLVNYSTSFEGNKQQEFNLSTAENKFIGSAKDIEKMMPALNINTSRQLVKYYKEGAFSDSKFYGIKELNEEEEYESVDFTSNTTTHYIMDLLSGSMSSVRDSEFVEKVKDALGIIRLKYTNTSELKKFLISCLSDEDVASHLKKFINDNA